MIRIELFIGTGLLLLISCKTITEKVPESSPLQVSISREIKGTIYIGGAYALYPLVQVWADSFMALKVDVQISMVKDGSGEGLSGLRTGKYDLAMVSTLVDDSDTTGEVAYIAVAQDAVVPIANKNNPYLQEIEEKGLTPQQFQELFISGERLTWGKLLDKQYRNDAVVFTRYDVSGAADLWARFFWKKQEDLKGSPVMGEDEMIKRVQSTPLGIGYSNLVNVFNPQTKMPLENISIIPIDLDFNRVIDLNEKNGYRLEIYHRSVRLGKYPRTLCRKLYIAVMIKNLNPLINSFLHYILTDGQKRVSQNGYLPVNNFQIKNSYELLEQININQLSQMTRQKR